MIEANVKVDEKQINKISKKLLKNIQASARRAVRKLSTILTNRIKNDKLKGQVLKKRTGNLRDSITKEYTQTDDKFTSRIYTNVPYARVHEYGFKGNVTVKQHVRNISKAFGKAIQTKQVVVNSHVRAANFPERSFMRSALSDIKPKIYDFVKAEIEKGLMKTDTSSVSDN